MSDGPVDPRSPCIVGVASRTWRPDAVGDTGAPEPLEMWAEVASAAASDARGRSVLEAVDSLDVVYCQTCQYDDPPRRLAERLRIAPARQHYSGIGGTTAQQLVTAAAESILSGTSDVALITGVEALATQRKAKRSGERIPYSFRPEGAAGPFPGRRRRIRPRSRTMCSRPGSRTRCSTTRVVLISALGSTTTVAASAS